MEDLKEIRDKLLRFRELYKDKEELPGYAQGYINGVLDFYNKAKDVISTAKRKAN